MPDHPILYVGKCKRTAAAVAKAFRADPEAFQGGVIDVRHARWCPRVRGGAKCRCTPEVHVGPEVSARYEAAAFLGINPSRVRRA